MDERERMDLDLAYLLDDADVLAETLAEWDEVSENERGIWQFEWPNDLAILEGLDRAHEAGRMSAEQERLYGELKAKLRELAPEIERALNLRVPPAVFT